MTKVKQIILKNHVNGREANEGDFEHSEIVLNENTTDLKEGEIIVKLVYVSVDPYLRGRIGTSKSYAASYETGKPMISICIGEVIKSNNPKWSVGDNLFGQFGWVEKFVFDGNDKSVYKVDGKLAPLQSYLSVLGMVGLTAYHGLNEIAEPIKQGETLVVSAGAGAVGSFVGQIGKIKGCKVVGIAGSNEKVEYMTKELGFDIGLNYNSPTYKDDIANACPNGVDIYFENVGGEVSDAIWPLLNFGARIPVCGVISTYNKAPGQDVGPRNQIYILKSSAKMQGFIVSNYASKNQEAIKQLSQWFGAGKIKDKHTINKGFDQIVPSFLSLFKGSNTGKLIIDLN